MRLKLLLFFMLAFSGVSWGQISESFESGLPTAYNSPLANATLGSGTWQIQDVIAGTTGAQTGTMVAQIRSLTAAQMISPSLTGGLGTISFYVTASTTNGAYQVNISNDNGANWIAATGSPFTISTTKTLRTITINNSAVNKIQIYRTGATIYIDDFITTTYSSGPTITLPNATLSGFNYVYGSDPSSEQSFTVSGSSLTDNLEVTPTSNFEISTGTGVAFVATNPITFTPSAGSVTSKTIYTRLKAGLSVASYNNEAINIISTGATTKSVTCSGIVNVKTLTINGLTPSDMIYDGTTTAIVTGTPTYNGLVSPDAFTVSGAVTWAFSTKNVGATLTRTGGYSAPSSNYTVTQPTLSANITLKSLSISAPTIASKVYDASAVSGTVTAGTLSGLVGTETLGVSAYGLYTDATVGTAKSATISYVLANGANGGLTTNYSLANGTATGDITKANPVFSSSPIEVSVGGTYALPGSISSTSPGTLSYSITGGDYATLAGITITGVSTGTETLTVNQGPSTNYNAASTTVSVSVSSITYNDGDWMSRSDGTWNNKVDGSGTTLWKKRISGFWVDQIAGAYPGGIAGSYTVFIANNVSIPTSTTQLATAKLYVMENGHLDFSASNLWTFRNIIIDNRGVLQANTRFETLAAGNFEIKDGGTLNFNYSANAMASTSVTSSILAGNEIFHPNSNFVVLNHATGSGNYFLPTSSQLNSNTFNGITGYFGNLIFQAGAVRITDTSLSNTSTYLTHGNLEFSSTADQNLFYGSGTWIIGGDFKLNNGLGGAITTTTTTGAIVNLVIKGNYSNESGQIHRLINTSTGSVTTDIDGDLSIISGSFDVNYTGGGSGSINLKGNLSVASGASLSAKNATTATLNFTGTTTQTIDVSNATTAANINFNVNSGATAQLINQDFAIGTNGTFTVKSSGTFDFGFNGATALHIMGVSSQTGQTFNAQSGSILKLTSPFGITTATTSAISGNVQTPVAGRTFDPATTYHYIGKTNQVSGNGLPSAITGKVIVEMDTDGLTFNASTNKTFNTGGTLEIRKGIVVDDSTNSFGDATSNTANLIMSGGRYKISKTGTQPAFSGTYNLTAGVVEYANSQTTAETVRTKSYQNIEITGNNVGNSGGNITLNDNGAFTVKNGGIFAINADAIVGPTGTQTVTVENGGTFKTGDVDGFNGGIGATATSVKSDVENINLNSGSTVEYAGATQTITSFLPAYSNLTISGIGIKTTTATTINVGNDLNIKSSQLTIDNAQAFVVTNKVNNTGGTFIIENNGSLVQVDDNAVNTGNITYKRNISTPLTTDYTYWSSPVANQNLDLSSFYTLGMFYSYDDFAIPEDWKEETAATIMKIGKGYIIRGPKINPPPGLYFATFYGKPNNGPQSIAVKGGTISNLIGNPYPSAIDAVNFLNTNSGIIEGTIYFWTHNTSMQNRDLIIGNNPDGTPKAGSGALAYTTDDYASYNLLGGVGTSMAPSGSTGGVNTTIPNGKIAAGQAFFTTSLLANGNVIFNNSMRFDKDSKVMDNSQFFKTRNPKVKTTTFEKHRIWLNLTNTQGLFKQTLVGYITDATNQYDSRFDGESFDGNEFVDFYSVNQEKNLVIQGRALPFDENDEVPLGFRTTINGDFSIKIDQTDGLLTNQDVFIEDKLTNTIFDLRSGPFTFKTVAGTFNDRFVLRYTNKTLGTIDLETGDNQVLVSNKNKQIKINSKVEPLDKVMVYDLLGRLLFKKDKVNSNELSILNLISNSETLLVKVTLQNGETVTRKILF